MLILFLRPAENQGPGAKQALRVTTVHVYDDPRNPIGVTYSVPLLPFNMMQGVAAARQSIER